MTVQCDPSTPHPSSTGRKSSVIETTPSACRSSRRSRASNVVPTRRPRRPARLSASAIMATLWRSCSQNTHGTPVAAAPGRHHRLGHQRHVAGEEDVGPEVGCHPREAAAVPRLLADPSHRRVAGERLTRGDRDDREVGVVPGVEPPLPAGVGAAVHVLHRVAPPGQGPAQVDLERVPGEVMYQHPQRATRPVDQPDRGSRPDVGDRAAGAATWIVVPHRRVPSPNVLPHRAPPARQQGVHTARKPPAPSRLTTTQVTEE